MSPQPIDLSPDLRALRKEGYSLTIRAGHLLIHDFPYVTESREVKRGTLITKLSVQGDVTIAPETHVAFFQGEHPCNANGSRLEAIVNATSQQNLGQGLVVDHVFSAKPRDTGKYRDYQHLVHTYEALIVGPARQIDSDVTAKVYADIPNVPGDDSPFNYIDTATARAEIGVFADKLRSQRVAIVGLGGTGSYLLDFLAKTPVKEIHLFDGDEYLQHNAFRCPGAPSIDELRERPRKVAYLAGIYQRMRRRLVMHPEYITSANVTDLLGFDFVFICVDKHEARRLMVDALQDAGRAFIDVGLGVVAGDEALGGQIRTTISTGAHQPNRSRFPLSDGGMENEYRNRIQIAELNALNAAFAVIRWKQHLGYYQDRIQAHTSVYTISRNDLNNGDRAT